jgi:hypothetical protein
MSARLVIVLSLALNVALGALVLRWATPPAAPAAMPRMPRLPPAESPPRDPGTDTNPPAAAMLSVEAEFHWSELAAEDLKVYRDNLRAVGCPEATVRDIILAEINHHFTRKRQALLADAQRRFWDVAARGDDALEAEWKEPLEKLDEARNALIAEVLGAEREDESKARTAQLRRIERQYIWLPEDQRVQITALALRHQQQLDEYWKAIQAHGPEYRPTPDESRQLERMQAEFATAQKALLGPEAFEEFQLRNSNASHWAARLEGFEATEAEWRAVARLKLDFETAVQKLDPDPDAPLDAAFRSRYGLPDSADTPTAEARRQMKLELEAATQAALGATRYDELKLAQDSDYRMTRRITQRHGLAETAARQTFEVQRAAAAEADQVRRNAELSAEARQAQLAALRQETERTLTETLGGNVFSTYQEYHGDWLQQLEQLPKD